MSAGLMAARFVTDTPSVAFGDDAYSSKVGGMSTVAEDSESQASTGTNDAKVAVKCEPVKPQATKVANTSPSKLYRIRKSLSKSLSRVTSTALERPGKASPVQYDSGTKSPGSSKGVVVKLRATSKVASLWSRFRNLFKSRSLLRPKSLTPSTSSIEDSAFNGKLVQAESSESRDSFPDECLQYQFPAEIPMGDSWMLAHEHTIKTAPVDRGAYTQEYLTSLRDIAVWRDNYFAAYYQQAMPYWAPPNFDSYPTVPYQHEVHPCQYFTPPSVFDCVEGQGMANILGDEGLYKTCSNRSAGNGEDGAGFHHYLARASGHSVQSNADQVPFSGFRKYKPTSGGAYGGTYRTMSNGSEASIQEDHTMIYNAAADGAAYRTLSNSSEYGLKQYRTLSNSFRHDPYGLPWQQGPWFMYNPHAMKADEETYRTASLGAMSVASWYGV